MGASGLRGCDDHGYQNCVKAFGRSGTAVVALRRPAIRVSLAGCNFSEMRGAAHKGHSWVALIMRRRASCAISLYIGNLGALCADLQLPHTCGENECMAGGEFCCHDMGLYRYDLIDVCSNKMLL